MGIILFIVASIILYIIVIPMIIVSTILTGKKADKYYYDLAFAIDQLGNVLCAPAFNRILLKRSPTKLYGNPDETISHVTGINKLGKTLTWLGLGLAWVLNKIDTNHVEKAANNSQINLDNN